MIYQTQEELDAAVKEWQAILRIQDWDVHALLLRKSAMVRSDVNGHIHIYRQHKICRIEICEAVDIENANDKIFPVDQERWLVHELLHLLLDPFVDHEDDSIEQRLYEQFTDSHARVLIGMKNK